MDTSSTLGHTSRESITIENPFHAADIDNIPMVGPHNFIDVPIDPEFEAELMHLEWDELDNDANSWASNSSSIGAHFPLGNSDDTSQEATGGKTKRRKTKRKKNKRKKTKRKKTNRKNKSRKCSFKYKKRKSSRFSQKQSVGGRYNLQKREFFNKIEALNDDNAFMDVPETDELLDPVIVDQQLNELTNNYTQREIIGIINNYQTGQTPPFRMFYLFAILLYLSRSIYTDYNRGHGNNYRFIESLPNISHNLNDMPVFNQQPTTRPNFHL